MHVPRQLPLHALYIESQLANVRQQVIVVQRSLSPEQQVVHLPKLPLRARRLGDLGRGLRVGVRLDHREVPEYKANTLPQVVQHTLELGKRATAEWALEVRVLDEGNAGVGRSPDVVPRAHGGGE